MPLRRAGLCWPVVTQVTLAWCQGEAALAAPASSQRKRQA
jgi:hypothetical protein